MTLEIPTHYDKSVFYHVDGGCGIETAKLMVLSDVFGQSAVVGSTESGVTFELSRELTEEDKGRIKDMDLSVVKLGLGTTK